MLRPLPNSPRRATRPIAFQRTSIFRPIGLACGDHDFATEQSRTAPAPRLYLVTPPVADATAFAAQLAAALAAGDVAAVLLRLAEADERTLINRAKALGAVVQDKDVALLLDGHADLVARAGADGAHLTGLAEFTEALGQLKPERIAGAGGLATRHDAMAAAEAGADYVMFGEPDDNGERPSFEAIEERVAWWAEVFEAPCVGFAASARRGGAAGEGRRRFHRARRLGLARSAGDRGDDRRRRAACMAAGDRGMTRSWRSTIALACLLRAAAQAPARRAKNAAAAAPNRRAAPARNADVAFGAYQRGFYLTALAEATKRAQQNDPPAMTLLGELYAQGLGVGRDDSKAAQWYKQAAALGDRDAMFALAMFNFEGRAGPRNPDEAARLLAGAAKLGHPAASYDLGLLYLQGQQFPQDFKRAAELFRAPPPTPAIRKRNTRSPPCTRKAAACRRTPARRRG